MRLLLVPLPLLTSQQLIASLTPYCIWGQGISLLPLLLLLTLLLSIILLPSALLEAQLLLLVSAVAGVPAVAGAPTANIPYATSFCKGSGLPAVLTSADVPNVCCAAVHPAVGDVLTAVAAVSTVVDFLLHGCIQRLWSPCFCWRLCEFIIYLSRVLCLCVCVCVTICVGTLSYSFSFSYHTD
jgi:hypothetical protein